MIFLGCERHSARCVCVRTEHELQDPQASVLLGEICSLLTPEQTQSPTHEQVCPVAHISLGCRLGSLHPHWLWEDSVALGFPNGKGVGGQMP